MLKQALGNKNERFPNGRTQYSVGQPATSAINDGIRIFAAFSRARLENIGSRFTEELPEVLFETGGSTGFCIHGTLCRILGAEFVRAVDVDSWDFQYRRQHLYDVWSALDLPFNFVGRRICVYCLGSRNTPHLIDRHLSNHLASRHQGCSVAQEQNRNCAGRRNSNISQQERISCEGLVVLLALNADSKRSYGNHVMDSNSRFASGRKLHDAPDARATQNSYGHDGGQRNRPRRIRYHSD